MFKCTMYQLLLLPHPQLYLQSPIRFQKLKLKKQKSKLRTTRRMRIMKSQTTMTTKIRRESFKKMTLRRKNPR